MITKPDVLGVPTVVVEVETHQRIMNAARIRTVVPNVSSARTDWLNGEPVSSCHKR